MKYTKHCLTAFMAIIISLMVWADSGELFTSGKLSSSLINCIVQDKYGYIWVGTEYGLSKFDGYRFTNYLHNEEDTTSITDNIISDLLVDKKGNLWIGCAKGLMRYNYETNDFVRLQFPDGRKPRIYSMVESHNGDILLGTAGYGLYSVKDRNTQKGTDNLSLSDRKGNTLNAILMYSLPISTKISIIISGRVATFYLHPFHQETRQGAAQRLQIAMRSTCGFHPASPADHAHRLYVWHRLL